MSEPMTLARFGDLADAYGGVIARWPAGDRDAALPIARSAHGAEILAAASALDETLDLWRVASPGAALHADVVATAPRAHRGLARRARLWWSGVGLAAALTGAVVGAMAVAIVAPVEAGPDSATSFGDVTAQEG